MRLIKHVEITFASKTRKTLSLIETMQHKSIMYIIYIK